MYTEAEAKEKWCPMIGSNPSGSVSVSCLASGCMAWRWDTPATAASDSHSTDQRLEKDGYRFVRAEGNAKIFENTLRRGSCGLASNSR